MRDAFSVLFFVSVGMLVDPMIMVEHPWWLLSAVLIIVLANGLGTLMMLLWLGYPLNAALTVGVSLGQMGEFSIILATLGVSLGLLTPDGDEA